MQSPTAFRIAVRNPDRVTAIITQNGNAYTEGLGKDFWAPLETYWAAPTFSSTSPEAQALLPFLQLGPTKWQYTHGVPEALLSRIAPEAYTLDAALLAREGSAEAQLSLFYDYRTNPKLYPQWQEYLRTSGVPVLAIWGANDPIFVKAGAQAFARDVKDFVLDFVDSGHFALETHVEYYAEQIDKVLVCEDPQGVRAVGCIVSCCVPRYLQGQNKSRNHRRGHSFQGWETTTKMLT